MEAGGDIASKRPEGLSCCLPPSGLVLAPLNSKGLQEIEQEQKAICAQFHLVWLATPPEATVIISIGVKEGAAPVYGMHSRPFKKNDSGWVLVSHATQTAEDGSPGGEYLRWAHARHLYETRPVIARYLGLPLGWRFIVKDVGEPYEDVWEDASLLAVEPRRPPLKEWQSCLRFPGPTRRPEDVSED